MKRLALIPVTGTLAALVAILLAHAPRGERPAARSAAPPPASAPAPETKPPTHIVRLNPDGSLEDLGTGLHYRTPVALMDALAPEGAPRPVVVVTNASPEVEESAVEAAVAALRKRCDVRKEYRGAEKDDEAK